MNCPPIADRIIFADDARLAARLSCALAAPGVYLAVCDGPRLQRAARVELAVGYALIAAAAMLFAYVAGWISPGSITSGTLIEDLLAHQGHP